MEIAVKVVPKSSKNEIAGELADGTLRVRVMAAPEKGKANLALRRFLADYYGVPLSSVRIVAGETSPRKRVRIEGVNAGA